MKGLPPMDSISTPTPARPPALTTPLESYRSALDEVFHNLSAFTPDFLALHALDGVLATVTGALDRFPAQGPHSLADHDYVLQEGAAWFTMNTLSVRLHTTDEGIVCDIHATGNENEGTIASCYAFFSEVEEPQDASGQHQNTETSPTSYWVDLPSPDSVGRPDVPMIHIATFNNPTDACAFAQEHFGTDPDGRLSLITPAPSSHSQALSRASRAAYAALHMRAAQGTLTQEERVAYEALATLFTDNATPNKTKHPIEDAS